MAFLHPVLLSALGLMAIPVILHFLLRPKPKQLIFPALRLIRERRKRNVRRFRLRHWWLLFLRMAAIGMIVFALTRPTLPAANYSLTGSELATLVTVVCAGIATYFLFLNKWQRRSMARFVFEQKRTSLRTWSTVGVILVLALALGIPYQSRVRGEIKAPPTTRQLDIPVAAVFLFDTSLSMEYQLDGRTRLEEAKRLALDHLSELPTGSRVAIAENASDIPLKFQQSLSDAQDRIESLETNAVAHPLGDRIRSAILEQREDRNEVAREFGGVVNDEDVTAAQDRFVRRIYIFTDLARSAWSFSGARILQGEIAEFEDLRIYVVDVGVLEPQNVGITEIELSKQRIPLGGNLFISATVMPRGMADHRTIAELHLADAAGNLAKRGQEDVPLFGDVPQEIQFEQITNLTGPVIHGEVRLISGDNLDIDDVRHFTVEIGAPPRVLVFAPDQSIAGNWLTALNPREGDNVKFDVEFRTVGQMDQPFGNADVIYLINVLSVSDENWDRLGRFVEEGGGLGVMLGDEDIESTRSYNRGRAQLFLPASLDIWREEDCRMSLEDVSHPILRKFRDYSDGAAILENDVRIFQFWSVAPAEGATSLITFTDENQSPALLERVHGKGRVVMFTTDVDVKPPGWRWNNFPLPTIGRWTYLAFAEQTTEHLSGSTDVVVNYIAGEDPFVGMASTPEEREFLLRKPGLTQQRLTLESGEDTLLIEGLDALGNYDLLTLGDRRDLLAGFSLNTPPGESDFTRLLDDELDQLLGEDAYHVARSIDELKGEIQASDIGQEMFPFILALAIVFFCGEHFVANRFYDPQAEEAAQSQTPT